MSERGSFVTGYIYCERCLEAAKGVLLGRDKYLCSVQIPSWVEGKLLPIIAGKIGSSYIGGDLDAMELMVEQLEQVICHDITISVLGESRDELFHVRALAEHADHDLPK